MKKLFQHEEEIEAIFQTSVDQISELLPDSVYELPVAYRVTKTSVPDINAAHNLFNDIEQTRPSLLKNAEKV